MAQRPNEQAPGGLREAIELLQRRQDATAHRRRLMQGLGRPIISAEVRDYRVVLVGDQLRWSTSWHTFTDFLFDYIKRALGAEWGNSELKKPLDERHPVLRWYEKVCSFQRTAAGTARNGVYSAEPTGAVSAFLGLAYDLYLAAHNAGLPEILLKRLRQADQFEGALYEAHVIGAFVSAGFSIAYEDEGDPNTSHCEFIATHTVTGRQFAVEAKAIASTASHAGSTSAPPKILKRLRRALAKRAEHERVVFIELSRAPDGPDTIPSWAGEVERMLRRAEAEMTIAGEPAPPAFVFVTNRSCVHALDSTDFADATAAFGFKIPEFPAVRPNRTLLQIVEDREAHIEMYWLLKGIVEHGGVPSSFDDRTPAEAFSDASLPRLRVGDRYLVPDADGSEVPGKLLDAVVDGPAKLATGLFLLDDERRIICSVPLSDEELEIYWESPDTFFGVIKKVGDARRKTPLELYDFFLETYSKSTREKLLEFMADWPAIDSYQALSQPELARIYCATIAEQEGHW